MALKDIEGHKSVSNFSVNPTLPNTFIYESILIKIYMNAEYFILLGMISKVIEGHKTSCNFSINPTLPNTLIYESILIKQIFHFNKYDLKDHLWSQKFIQF